MMKLFATAAALVLLASTASAGPVLQTGSVTPGHIAVWATNGVIEDGGKISGTGTVTSVGLAAPSWLTVSGSPVTVSGTLTLTGTSETQNQFLASPNGSSGALTPRSIVNADLPTSGVSAGSYTSANITVNAQGVVTAAANGSGGVSSVTGTSGQVTASPTTGAVVVGLPTTITQAETFSAAVTLNGTLSGTGLTTYLASPAAIGGTAPAAGAFTTLGATSTVTLGSLTSAGTECVQASSSGVLSVTGSACGSGSGAVNSVTNSDGTLTISPTTGSVVASLALGHANTWTAAQTFTNSDLKLLGSSTGATTFTSANSGASNFTITVPAATDTLAMLGQAQTFTAAQSFTNGDLQLLGSSSGHSTLEAPATGGGVITFPSGAATLLSNALASADLFVGNGSGVATAVALAGDCTLANTGSITCTKTSGTAFAASATTDTTNAANISSGTLPTARMPALTGDVTSTVNTVATTVGKIQGNSVPSGATTDGQLLIGDSSTGNWDKSTLTAGTNVTITNGHGTITIAASGGGSGCTTSGTSGDVLTDNGSGGCSSQADVTVSSNNLIINQSGSAAPAIVGSGGGSQIVMAANTTAVYQANAFGTGSGSFTFEEAAGTPASPTAVAGNTVLGVMGGSAYNGTAYGSSLNSVIQFFTGTSQTTSNSDGFIVFKTTGTGSTSNSRRFTLETDGTGYFGSNTSVTANNCGSGCVNVDTGFTVANTTTANKFLATPNGTTGVASLRSIVAADLPADVAYLDVAQAWTAAQRGTPTNIAISTATFTPNFNTAQNFEIDLTSACPCTLANPSTTLVAGQSGMIEIHQDATGSRTIGTWGADYLTPGGTSSITLSTAASAVDYLPYYVNNAATGIVLGALIKAPSH